LSIRPVSCVPKVASFSGLSIRPVSCVPKVASFSGLSLWCSLTFTYIAMLNNSTNNKTENYISPSLTDYKKTHI
jgi:hypothetical protein